MATQQLKTLANRLYEAGLAVIPTGENKRAITAQWQTLVGENRIAPNGNFDKTARGVGVITGHTVTGGYLLALDVDCYDKDVSSHMAEYIADLVGKPMPYRVGQRPKFLVPVICDETTRKITSRAYTDCFAPDDQPPSKLEVLGLGQQFVAYGEHPSAVGGQYKWYNGEFELDAIPKVTLTQVRQIIAEFEAKAEEGGLEPVKASLKSSEQPPVDNPFVGLIKSDVSLAEAAEIISHIDPDCDYETWFRVGAGLHHEFEGDTAAFDLWSEWSEKGDKFAQNEGANNPQVKWDSFGSSLHTVGFRTVCAYAREAGADLSAISRKHKAKAPVEITLEVEPTPEPSTFARQVCAISEQPVNVHEWVIYGALDAHSLNAIYGKPKEGKSFIALDQALSIAYGMPWAGCDVRQGAVLYVAGEGNTAIWRRVAAWQIEHGKESESAPMFITNRNVLITQQEELNNLVSFILSMPTPPKAIYLDTYARVTAGIKENDSEDTGRVVSIMDGLKEKFGSAVIAVHHTPKGDGEDMRGSGALAGAVDSSALVKKDGNTVTYSQKLVKEAAAVDDLVFKLISIQLPNDKFQVADRPADHVTSAVARFDPDAKPSESSRKLSPMGKSLLEALRYMLDNEPSSHCPIPTEMSIEAHMNIEGVAIDANMAREHFYKLIGTDKAENTLRKNYHDAKNRVSEAGVAKLFGEVFVLFK